MYEIATTPNNLIWKCVKIYYDTLIQFWEFAALKENETHLLSVMLLQQKNEASL